MRASLLLSVLLGLMTMASETAAAAPVSERSEVAAPGPAGETAGASAADAADRMLPAVAPAPAVRSRAGLVRHGVELGALLGFLLFLLRRRSVRPPRPAGRGEPASLSGFTW